MPKHFVISNPVNQVDTEHFAPNDATPSPTGMHKVASAFNYVSCRQKKVILTMAQSNIAPVSATGPEVLWGHYFRTGENTTSVVVRYGATTPVSPASAGTFTYTIWVFSAGTYTDTAAGSTSHSFDGSIAAGAVNPSQVGRYAFRIDGLSPNTEYHGAFSVQNGTQILFVQVHEAWQMAADDAVTAVCNPDKYHAEGPIYDEHANDLNEANNRLWRHNGAPYIGWVPDYVDSTAPTTTSGAFADILANNRGFYINSAYHSTRRRTGSAGVPVKMGVKCYVTSGGVAGGEFRLTDGTHNIDITGVTVPLSATFAQWFTTTANIPDTSATWEMQARRVSGTGTIAIAGWSLFPYET